jgi:hypothetical protein
MEILELQDQLADLDRYNAELSEPETLHTRLIIMLELLDGQPSTTGGDEPRQEV